MLQLIHIAAPRAAVLLLYSFSFSHLVFRESGLEAEARGWRACVRMNL